MGSIPLLEEALPHPVFTERPTKGHPRGSRWEHMCLLLCLSSKKSGCHVILGCKDWHAEAQNHEGVHFSGLCSEAVSQNSHVKKNQTD